MRAALLQGRPPSPRMPRGPAPSPPARALSFSGEAVSLERVPGALKQPAYDTYAPYDDPYYDTAYGNDPYGYGNAPLYGDPYAPSGNVDPYAPAGNVDPYVPTGNAYRDPYAPAGNAYDDPYR